jgi:hypothetical protein|nr:MAG TPA: Protein of unknown function (DUF2500) [Caudoviricetes sp.]
MNGSDIRISEKAVNLAMVISLIWLLVFSSIGARAIIQERRDDLYIGKVVQKEHMPEEIRDGERYLERYYIVVKDKYNELLRYSVSKEVYEQLNINDMYKRK